MKTPKKTIKVYEISYPLGHKIDARYITATARKTLHRAIDEGIRYIEFSPSSLYQKVSMLNQFKKVKSKGSLYLNLRAITAIAIEEIEGELLK